MVVDLFLPMVKANELCERAVRYRRSLVASPLIDAADLRRLIQFSIPRTTAKPDSDGWVHISNLIDRIEGRQAEILWEPGTDRVRLKWDKARPKR